MRPKVEVRSGADTRYPYERACPFVVLTIDGVEYTFASELAEAVGKALQGAVNVSRCMAAASEKGMRRETASREFASAGGWASVLASAQAAETTKKASGKRQ